MLVSFVVRLVVDDLQSGAIAGEVHNVATGERAVVRSFEDLLAMFARGTERPCTSPRTDLGDSIR
ncbi:MAG: hypothetical protein QOJ67_3788 [Acidimicrobiaceae bacterium]